MTTTPTAPARFAPVRVVPAVLALLGVLAVAAALVAGRVPALDAVRPVATVAFLLVGPGWALAAFVRGPSLARRAVLAVATGLALSIVAGQAMVVAGAWHPVGLMIAVAAVAVPLLVRHAVAVR